MQRNAPPEDGDLPLGKRACRFCPVACLVKGEVFQLADLTSLDGGLFVL